VQGNSFINRQQASLGVFSIQNTFGFMVHVLDSVTVRVVFDTEVNESALNPDSYLLLPISGVPQIFVPDVLTVKFFDSEKTSVSVSFSAPLTYTAIYSMQLTDVLSIDGRTSTASTYNFIATVQDSPLVVGAYLSDRSHLDVIFDRPVRDTSASVSARIFPILQGNILSSSVLILVSSAYIPENNIRFRIQSDLLTGDSFLIQYENVTDSSYNTSLSGQTFLDVKLPSLSPWSYADISSPSVTSAYIDKVVSAENKIDINIFFSCPMLDSDVSNTLNWTVTKEGVHLSGVSSPVTALDPSDDASLIALCVDLRNKFNDHLSGQDIHYEPANNPPSITAVIGLLNDLLEKYNSHSVSVPSHSFPDRDDTVQLKPAFTVEQAVVLSILLKEKYNTHLGALHGSTPYHSIHDVENPVTSPDPVNNTDLYGASLIADELKTRLLMHELGQWHSIPDTINHSDFPYSNHLCTFPSIATVSEAISFLNELQLKYILHIISRKPHAYQDDVNTITRQVVIDESTAMSVSVLMKNTFNGHILYEFPVEVNSVSSFTSSSSSASVKDSFTYMARMGLNGSSSVPKYSINAGLNSEDNNYSLFNFSTKLFNVTEVMSTSPRKKSLASRTSVGLSIPKSENISINAITGQSIHVTSILLDSSIHTIQGLITEMMDVFRTHLSESGISSLEQIHNLTDTIDNFDDSHIPGMNESSIVVSVNFLKNMYNRHVSNVDGQYHVFQASVDSVNKPDATDFHSAMDLAAVLNKALSNHRNNLSSHYDHGPELQFSKVFDTLVVCYDGLTNGSVYTLTADLNIVSNDLNSSSFSENISAPFYGVSDYPLVASAIPEP
jgi:hypothetical protein